MNIVTVFDYDFNNLKYRVMLQMFVKSIQKHCSTYPYKLWIITSQPNKINHILNDSNIITMPAQSTSKFVPKSMHNIKNKLYNLCSLEFEFIFLDCDMYIAADLSYLWDRRKDKPFISTIHQKNIEGPVYGKHVGEDNFFMNSGVQIVSDPSFLDYDKLRNFALKREWVFKSPGTDQALLDMYLKENNYDFTHKEIGCEWNSCAKYGIVTMDSLYNFDIKYKNQDEEYPVKINHYWSEFKPWLIKCPIFQFYKELYE